MNCLKKYEELRASTRRFAGEDTHKPLLALRLTSLIVMVALLTMHLRSLRVFRWEHSVTGGITVAYFVATLGQAMCAGTQHCGGAAFQAYLSGTGAALMAVNAAAIWQRWKRAGELTRVVAELLAALGIRLKIQVWIKVTLSIIASFTLLIDFVFAPILLPQNKSNETKSFALMKSRDRVNNSFGIKSYE